MELSQINYQPLFTWINKELNTDVEFKIDLSGRRLETISPNLVENSGLFAAAFSQVTVDIFNYTPLENGYWGTVCVSYKTFKGGSNGVVFGEFEWNDVAGWKVVSYKDGKWVAL